MDTNTTRKEESHNFSIVRITGDYMKPITFHAYDWLRAIGKARYVVERNCDDWKGHSFQLSDYPMPKNRKLVFCL